MPQGEPAEAKCELSVIPPEWVGGTREQVVNFCRGNVYRELAWAIGDALEPRAEVDDASRKLARNLAHNLLNDLNSLLDAALAEAAEIEVEAFFAVDVPAQMAFRTIALMRCIDDGNRSDVLLDLLKHFLVLELARTEEADDARS